MRLEVRVSNQKQNQKNNLLKVGDSVIIANLFFANHGLSRKEIGAGYIVSIEHAPTECVEVDFRFHPVFLQCVKNGYIYSCLQFKENNVYCARVKIHPVYLDKI